MIKQTDTDLLLTLHVVGPSLNWPEMTAYQCIHNNDTIVINTIAGISDKETKNFPAHFIYRFNFSVSVFFVLVFFFVGSFHIRVWV